MACIAQANEKKLTQASWLFLWVALFCNGNLHLRSSIDAFKSGHINTRTQSCRQWNRYIAIHTLMGYFHTGNYFSPDVN
jgi:hypothetical protein